MTTLVKLLLGICCFAALAQGAFASSCYSFRAPAPGLVGAGLGCKPSQSGYALLSLDYTNDVLTSQGFSTSCPAGYVNLGLGNWTATTTSALTQVYSNTNYTYYVAGNSDSTINSEDLSYVNNVLANSAYVLPPLNVCIPANSAYVGYTGACAFNSNLYVAYVLDFQYATDTSPDATYPINGSVMYVEVDGTVYMLGGTGLWWKESCNTAGTSCFETGVNFLYAGTVPQAWVSNWYTGQPLPQQYYAFDSNSMQFNTSDVATEVLSKDWVTLVQPDTTPGTGNVLHLTTYSCQY